MRTKSIFLKCFIILLLFGARAAAESLTIRGIVHDPQHRPIPGASVTLSTAKSVVALKTQTNSQGEFELARVPIGNYSISVAASGFAALKQPLQVDSKDLGILHLQMAIASVAQRVEVSGAAARLNTQSATTRTSISQQQIAQTPGGDLTNSLAMITDFVPGAYMVHDMLHVRGGHQENWFFDGIPVINTNIASNAGPMINPKDVESLEVQTGGYSSEYGDRTYGFFNVITPSGFDKSNQGELMASYGSFNQTDNLLSFGGHSERFAYYGSLDGNRSDLGLSTPTPFLIHAQENGLGGFASILFNPSAENQLRFVASLRGDHYQIPNTPDQQATGIRDLDVERDDMFGFTWAHSSPGGMILTVSPFFHFNRADYIGGPNDTPSILNNNRRSSYMGALASLALDKEKHNGRLGAQVWGQHDNTFFGLRANPGSQTLVQSFLPWANSEAVFGEDQYKATSWLTFNGGIRVTHYGGLISENAADPRLGAALRIPRLGWILRGY
ncbi:MAG: carboxypeptidase regulatory-like domain-containing protein, partial [Candidatus Dormibacteraceae bacterium]